MKQLMVFAVLSLILLMLLGGCTSDTVNPADTKPAATEISENQALILTEQDLQQLGMAKDPDNSDLVQLGIIGNGTNCQAEEQTSFDSSMVEYTICSYIIPSLNSTQIIIELRKFASPGALNDTYQYDSSHLYSAEGLISENDFGDQSRFRINNENDYGGQYNPQGVYFYHLWFTRNEFLVHITSKGSEEAKDSIAEIGHQILSKLG